MAETPTTETNAEAQELSSGLTGAAKVATEKVHKNRLAAMADWAATTERVDVRVPKVMGDQTVFINGYMFQIKAGETVKVPVEVRNILERGQRI